MKIPAYGGDPATYVVYTDAKPRKGKPGTPFTSRMAGFYSLEEARKAIEENEREIRHPNSYGGLIDWGDDNWHRHYRIFKAEYIEVK